MTKTATLITAAVVTRNEAAKLDACLESLFFADELVVVDLESDDDPAAVARRHGATVRRRAVVPVVEEVREEIAVAARHDWVLYLDPDERLPAGSEDELRDAIGRQSGAAAVRMPWQFYFAGQPLTTTVWGREQEKTILVHRHRVRFHTGVHRGIEPLPGHPVVTLPRSRPDFAIQHLWVDGWADLLAKHRRYLAQEGHALHHAGQRFAWRRALHHTGWALKHSLVRQRGWAGGPRGIALSLFFAAYTFLSWISLRRYESTL